MSNPSPEHLKEVVQSVQPEVEKDLAVIRDIALDYESAALAVSELEGLQTQELDGTTIYSGKHPKHGCIHIVMPAAGSGMMLLPFVFRDF
jgi:hypothetical protein